MNQDELGKGKQWIQKILQSYLNLGPRSKSEVGKEFFLYFCLGSESGRGAGHGFGLPPTWASWDQGMFLLLARILWTISGDAQRTPCWHLIPLPIEGPQKQGPESGRSNLERTMDPDHSPWLWFGITTQLGPPSQENEQFPKFIYYLVHA